MKLKVLFVNGGDDGYEVEGKQQKGPDLDSYGPDEATLL